MKISIMTAKEQMLIDQDFRPLYNTQYMWELESDPYKADAIYLHLDYLDCNKEFNVFTSAEWYKDNADKCFTYAMHDTPSFAYTDRKCLKFLCQPLFDQRVNKEHKIVSVPLQMRLFEYALIQDRDFIERCRNQKKEYDFVFIGQTKYSDRAWLRPENMGDIGRYLFRETNPIWGVRDVQTRVNVLKEFCLDVAKARYSFSPRGIGSSSFRLYQSLMVGTVPLIYGMNDYPFDDILDWSEFSFSPQPSDKIEGLLDFNESHMRQAGTETWDKYFHMDNTDRYIFDRYLRNIK